MQGKSYRDTHIVPLDTLHKHFDMRKLILGMSRTTHGKYVHVATGLDEKKLLAADPKDPAAQQAYSDAVEVDEPDDIMAYSGEICVDEEEDWDPSLY